MRSASETSHSQRCCFGRGFHRARIGTGSGPMTPAHDGRGEPRLRAAPLGGILLAIDRSDMRRIPIKIRAPDPEVLLVRIDPFPKLFARGETLQTGLALDAHEIGRKSMAVAAAAAPAMK